MGTKSKLVWQIDLSALIGKMIKIETHDGHYRTGVLRAVEWSNLFILGMEWQYPSGLKLDMDEGDMIPWTLIRSVTLLKLKKEEKA